MIIYMFKWSILILVAGWFVGQFTFFPLAFQFLAVIVFNVMYVLFKIGQQIKKLFSNLI